MTHYLSCCHTAACSEVDCNLYSYCLESQIWREIFCTMGETTALAWGDQLTASFYQQAAGIAGRGCWGRGWGERYYATAALQMTLQLLCEHGQLSLQPRRPSPSSSSSGLLPPSCPSSSSVMFSRLSTVDPPHVAMVASALALALEDT